MAWETEVQSQVESYERLKKWYLIFPCLTPTIIRYGSIVNGAIAPPWDLSTLAKELSVAASVMQSSSKELITQTDRV